MAERRAPLPPELNGLTPLRVGVEAHTFLHEPTGIYCDAVLSKDGKKLSRAFWYHPKDPAEYPTLEKALAGALKAGLVTRQQAAAYTRRRK